jgi:hypothetical protein
LIGSRPCPDLPVDAAQHGLQQVGVFALIRIGLSGGDQLIDERVLDRYIFPHPAMPAEIEAALDWKLAQAIGGVLQRINHRDHERMRLLAVEGIEAIGKSAQPDRIERQSGHVGGDVDILAWIEPRPFLHQLSGNVAHLWQIAADRHRAERRRQDIVRLLPVRLVGPGGEQAIANDDPSLQQSGSKDFVEPMIIADFIDQLEARQHRERAARKLEPEYWPIELGKLDQVEQRRIALEVEQIADDRMTGRLGNEIQRGLRHHALFSVKVHPPSGMLGGNVSLIKQPCRSLPTRRSAACPG